MTNNQLTRGKVQWLHDAAEEAAAVGIKLTMNPSELLMFTSELLATMDSEPVAWTWHYREQWHVTNDERRAEFVAKDGDVAVLPLYRHAQSAQISEPVLPLQDKDLQGVIDALEHPAGINAAGKQVVRHALVEIQERRKADREPVAEVVSIYGDPEAFGEREIRPLVGIQQMPYGTKLYRHAQPAPVVPEEATPDSIEILASARRRDHAVFQWNEDQRNAAADSWNACRAAMLQAQPDDDGEPTDDERIMTIEGILNCERCGDEGWIVGEMGITRCACSQAGNSPVIPDGYVMVPKEPTEDMIAEAMNCDDVRFNSDESFCVQFGNIYEAMLAAAPQEVKP